MTATDLSLERNLPMSVAISGDTRQLRVLVAIASYGNSNDSHLLKSLNEYRSMPFDIDIVVFSNLNKENLGCDIEVLVGLPDKNPWSLPFAHKKVFAERLEEYDLFVYSEDDILIAERHLRAFLEVSKKLHEDEIPGFIRFETNPAGRLNYPDVHGQFHWDPASVTSRGKYVLASFTNDHSACYVLTQDQLRRAIKSGGFLVKPHDWKYDLLCSAATDPYTQCGFTKLVPISHLDDFSVHHLSNKYMGNIGIDGSEMRLQIGKLLQISRDDAHTASLLQTETKLWRMNYSKDYYEPICGAVLSMVPPKARSILSIGCGFGATERRLVERGLRVVAVPLDPVICGSAAEAGVEILNGDFLSVRERLARERFDCVLYLNVLHLIRDPVAVLSAFNDILSIDAAVIIQAPNMPCAPNIWKRLRHPSRFRGWGSYDSTGVHFTSLAIIRRWCDSAGLETKGITEIVHKKIAVIYNLAPGIVRNFVLNRIRLFLAPEFVTLAHKNISTRGE